MEFLGLPDDIIIDMMINKFSLGENTNLIKTNRRMGSLFKEIKKNETLYRQYLDIHFPYLKEAIIALNTDNRFEYYILYPYIQELYKGLKHQMRREYLIGGSIVDMIRWRGNDSTYFYLTNLGEIYIFKGGISQKISNDKYFSRMIDSSDAIFFISEDGEIYIWGHNEISYTKIVIDSPDELFMISYHKGEYTILKNDGEIYINTTAIAKYDPPKFALNISRDHYFITEKDPSILINLETGNKELLDINVMNIFNIGYIYLIDEEDDVYRYDAYRNNTIKIKFKENRRFSNILCIGSWGSEFIIIDNSYTPYWCNLEETVGSIIPIEQVDSLIDPYEDHEIRDYLIHKYKPIQKSENQIPTRTSRFFEKLRNR